MSYVSLHLHYVHVIILFFTNKIWPKMQKMNGVLGCDLALYGYTEPGITWDYDMNFIINHTPGAGSIA